MGKKILGVIPARGGSKGVPRKNVRDLGGTPLIRHIFESARKSEYISRLILSTEDEEIAAVGKEIGMEVPFMRPKEFSTDSASLISVTRHALHFFDESGFRADGVISLQPTNPFLSAESIDKAIQLWLNTGCDSVTSIAVSPIHPYITKKLKEDGKIENFCLIPEGIKMGRRQDREVAYYLTGAIYLRTRTLLEADYEDGHHLGEDSRAVVLNETEATDINTQSDFEFAEWLMSRKMGQL